MCIAFQASLHLQKFKDLFTDAADQMQYQKMYCSHIYSAELHFETKVSTDRNVNIPIAAAFGIKFT